MRLFILSFSNYLYDNIIFENSLLIETSALDGNNCSKALQILMQEIYNKYASKNLGGSKSSNPENISGQVLSSGETESNDCAC